MWEDVDESSFFFFNDTATTEIYTLSLHDALPISAAMALADPGDREIRTVAIFSPDASPCFPCGACRQVLREFGCKEIVVDRKSTRLNSSHANISYAVFCLKKKHRMPLYITFSSPI